MNYNHIVIPALTHQNALKIKRMMILNTGNDLEEINLTYIVSKSVNLNNHFGKCDLLSLIYKSWRYVQL